MSMDDTQVLNLVQDSLVRRMRTMFSLYYDAVDTMSLEQVNHFSWLTGLSACGLLP